MIAKVNHIKALLSTSRTVCNMGKKKDKAEKLENSEAEARQEAKAEAVEVKKEPKLKKMLKWRFKE